jgi:anti-sigma B factor antagonist
MKLSLHSTDNAVLILQCEGSITQSQMKPGIDLVEQVAGRGVYSRRVLFNLEKTSFIDSSGIGWLLTCHKRFREQKGKLVFYHIPPLVKQTFDLLRLGSALHLAADEPSARHIALEEASQ